MRNRLIASVLLVALMFTAPIAAASEPASLVGETVRLQLTNGQVLYGEVTVDTNAILIVHLEESGKPVEVGRPTITKIEIGHHRSRGKTVLWGALIGLSVGVLGGYAQGDDPKGLFSFTAGEKATIEGVLATPIGALVGLVIGPGKTHWTDVTPQKPTMNVSPVVTLHSLGLNGSVRW